MQVLADTALVDMPQVLYADGRDSVVVRAKDNISVLLPDSCDTSGITLTVQYDSEAPLEAPLEAETLSLIRIWFASSKKKNAHGTRGRLV